MGVVGFGAGVLFTRNGSSEAKPEGMSAEAATSTPLYANRAEMLRAAEEIAEVLGQDAVCYDADVLEHHGPSEWSTSNSPGRAVAVHRGRVGHRAHLQPPPRAHGAVRRRV
jgi:D-lactate dehydrogenase (cytochrome)